MGSPAALSPPLHVVGAGAGAAVACLHSSGSSASQWRALVAAGQDGYRFFAVDLYGHGRSPHFAGADYSLAAEADAVLARLPASEPVHLVGHSYGGAVALHIAVAHPDRVASLTVFEPVLFGVLDRASVEWGEITSIGSAIARAARAGAPEAASAAFVDYWNGADAWRRLPAEHQQRVQGRIVDIARHFEALFADPLPWASLRMLRVPTRVLCGADSPAPARAVCERLRRLPAAGVEVLAGLSHMGPLTHAERVNARILDHVARHAAAFSKAA
jgi:pimeloyl-ACP methyl ester carboxylesterase